MWSDALTDAREYGIAATDGKAINGKCTFPPRDKRDLFFFHRTECRRRRRRGTAIILIIRSFKCNILSLIQFLINLRTANKLLINRYLSTFSPAKLLYVSPSKTISLTRQWLLKTLYTGCLSLFLRVVHYIISLFHFLIYSEISQRNEFEFPLHLVFCSY